MRRRYSAVLAALLALSSPAAALAQSAGDDQYRDPFGEEEQPQQEQPQEEPGSGGSQGGGDTNAGETPPATPAPAPTTPAPAVPAEEPIATTAETLPRTGLAAGVVAALGFGLLAAGLGLRRSATRLERA